MDYAGILCSDAQRKAEREAENDKAIRNSEKHLHEIVNDVKSIDIGLIEERIERKAADEANLKLTKRWNRISLAVGIAGLILALFSIFKP